MHARRSIGFRFQYIYVYIPFIHIYPVYIYICMFCVSSNRESGRRLEKYPTAGIITNIWCIISNKFGMSFFLICGFFGVTANHTSNGNATQMLITWSVSVQMGSMRAQLKGFGVGFQIICVFI